jgi:hypothetical protein
MREVSSFSPCHSGFYNLLLVSAIQKFMVGSRYTAQLLGKDGAAAPMNT